MRMNAWISLAVAVLAWGAAAAAIGARPADVDAARIRRAETDGRDWPSHGRTYSEQRYSPLTQINDGNVARLGLAWTQTLDYERGVETTPIVVDGVMYATGPWSLVYAFAADTGKLLWKFDPQVDRERSIRACCGPVNRGVAVWQGKVYVGALDGRLIALDARDGKPVWSVQTFIDLTRSYTITGAPRVVKGKVLIGNGGAELGVRGYVSAYDAGSGKLKWRFFTVPGDPGKPFESPAMAMAAKTWSGDQWWTWGGGGTVWDAMSYDPELDLLYIGVGNGSPWSRNKRSPGGGDNLFLSSVVALRPDSGEYVWHFQLAPGEQWDYPATAQLVLADLPVDGARRKVLIQVPKHGFVYVLDRKTGQLLSADKFTKVTWATGYDLMTGRPQETEEADYTRTGKPTLLYPSMLGGHNWNPIAYNPNTGLAYFGELQAGAIYAVDNNATFRGGNSRFNMAQNFPAMVGAPELQAQIERERRGSLMAWDVRAKKVAWQVEQKLPISGGTLATAGNLVFQGAADGRLVAYAADSGKVLWEITTYGSMPGGPVTYSVRGQQYVAVGIGWGGAFPGMFADGAVLAGYTNPSRIAVWRLDGQGKLPPPALRQAKVAPPPMTAPIERVMLGVTLFATHCGFCHGPGFGGKQDLDTMAPDIHENFSAVVLGGRVNAGMPSFHEQLKADDVQAIHDFLIMQATMRKAREAGVPQQATEAQR